MCNSRLGKGSKKKCVRVFVSGSTRSHSPAQDLGQFKVNVNPFNHNLKIILTSGGDGSFWAFFFFLFVPKLKKAVSLSIQTCPLL